MNQYAKEIFEALPKDGSKITGGDLRAKISLSRSQYDEGKAWLKEHGLITLGRGRGGSVALIKGAELPEEPKKLSKAEVMKFAREEKEEKSRMHKRHREIHDAAMKLAEENFSDAEKIYVQVWNPDIGECYVYPFYDGTAQAYRALV